MKPGVRAVGVAESYAADSDRSTLAAAVVRRDRVVDDLAFDSCTVGGADATAAVVRLLTDLDRPDAQYVLLAGIAPAWYNVLDLHRLAETVERPVLSVSFEASPGLADVLAREFDGDALDTRLAVYERQPPRTALDVNGDRVWVRAVGHDDPAEIVRAFTPEGGRPEPVRVARIAARAADAFAHAGDAFTTDS